MSQTLMMFVRSLRQGTPHAGERLPRRVPARSHPAPRRTLRLHRQAGSPEIAARYIEAIVTYCEGLTDFPHRGSACDDIRPGLRTIGYKKRVIIAFAVLDDRVAILGIFYGGRDYETILAEANDE